MKRSDSMVIAITTFMTVAINGCGLEADRRSPRNGMSTNKTSPLSNAVIARVSADPQNSSMGKLELVASDQLITKNTHVSQIESAFKSGQPLGLKKEGMALTASNALNGSTFALYECPPGYYSPYSGQAPQVASNQPNIGIDNLFSAFGEGGGLFNNLLSGLNTSDGGGILESLSGSLQSIIGLFTSGSAGTVALPYGQTVSDVPSYGCVPIPGTTASTNTWNTPSTTTPATTTATANSTPESGAPQVGPTPYPYIGQVQSGPYTYYSYALPPTAEQQPVNTGSQN